MGRGHLREFPVSVEKTLERSGAALNDFQASLKVRSYFRFDAGAGNPRIEASRNRFDGSQRIAQLMPEHANQALPRLSFFLAQRAANVREHHQSVGYAVLAKRTS